MAGSISRITQTGRYRARIRDHAGKQQAKHFKTKREAREWLNEQTARQRSAALPIDEKRAAMTFRDYTEQRWKKLRHHSPQTARLVDRVFRKRVYPTLGDLSMREITDEHISSMVASLQGTYSPESIRLALMYTRSVLSEAVRDRIFAESPADRLAALPRPTSTLEVPRSAEISAVVATIEPLYRAPLLLGSMTGVRIGEALGVTVDRIDWENGRIRIDRQLTRAGARPQWGPLKTKASERTVPMPPPLADAIMMHIEQFGLGPYGLLWRSSVYSALSRSTLNTAIQVAAATAGVNLYFHMLRHHYASLLIEGGESIKVVQARLGHSTAAETLDTYGHLLSDRHEETQQIVTREFGGLVSEVLGPASRSGETSREHRTNGPR